MMLAISSLSVYRLQKHCIYYHFHLEDSLKNIYLNILQFFGSLSCIGKVIIIKGVSNTIGIGYCLTIIKGQYSWYTGCYSF